MQLKERISKALGWTLEEVNSLSMPSIRELLRPEHPELAREVTLHMEGDAYIVQKTRDE